MQRDNYEYDGFISYSHEDVGEARRVQRYLEDYSLPVGRPRLKIYRDDTDIRSGSLPAELENALARSRTLIVLCSPGSARSEWVQSEIATFRSDDSVRSIVLLLVKGQLEDSVPEALRNNDIRYSDIRNGWVLGLMLPRPQVEMVRIIASVADLELRDLIPWDKRRRQRNIAIASVVIIVTLAGAAFFPFKFSREVELPPNTQGQQTLEYCDIVDGRLVLTAREQSAGRNKSAYIDNALDTAGRSEEWLDGTQFMPARRIVHESAAPREWYGKLRSALDIKTFRQHARTAAEQREQELNPHVWLGEPEPGRFLILRAMEPRAQEAADEHEPPPAGAVVVGIGTKAGGTSISVIDGLYPVEPSNSTLGRQSANFNHGLPAAAMNGTVWIGMPTRENGGIGGLWEYSDDNNTWTAMRVSGSVNSLLPNPETEQLLVAMAPGNWKGSGRSGVYAAGIRLTDVSAGKAGNRDKWITLEKPPIPTESDVQFCGFLNGSTLLTRVDRKILATGPYNLLRLWTGIGSP